MSNIIYCYCYPDMADFEVTLLLHRLRCIGGRRVVTIADSPAPVTGQTGMRYLPHITVDQASAEEAEALIIPGGPINNSQNAILPLIRQMHRQKKLIAAICFGPQFLARAGLLHSLRYTTSCMPEHIAALGVEDPFPRDLYIDRRILWDENVITAQGHAFLDFALAVFRGLGLSEGEEQEYELFGKLCRFDHRQVLKTSACLKEQ